MKHENLRTIKSYVLRAGRITARQQIALDEYWQDYGLTVEEGMMDIERVYGRKAPLILEIGFGMGDALINMAEENPDINYLGVEVHRPGVGAVLAETADLRLDNLRVYAQDVHQVLNQCIPDASLDSVLIFFPDPWPKKRHHKRRLIQLSFLDLIWAKLKPQGKIHIATDIKEYAEHVIATFKQHAGFISQYPDSYAPQRPKERPLTKFELKGNKLGHDISDIIYLKLK